MLRCLRRGRTLVGGGVRGRHRPGAWRHQRQQGGGAWRGSGGRTLGGITSRGRNTVSSLVWRENHHQDHDMVINSVPDGFGIDISSTLSWMSFSGNSCGEGALWRFQYLFTFQFWPNNVLFTQQTSNLPTFSALKTFGFCHFPLRNSFIVIWKVGQTLH